MEVCIHFDRYWHYVAIPYVNEYGSAMYYESDMSGAIYGNVVLSAAVTQYEIDKTAANRGYLKKNPVNANAIACGAEYASVFRENGRRLEHASHLDDAENVHVTYFAALFITNSPLYTYSQQYTTRTK